MNTRHSFSFSILLLLFTSVISAQVIQVNDNYSAQQLVDVLIGGSCAEASNVVVSGWNGSSGGNSYGYFTSGTSGFPFNNGILLSTGFAASAPGPNDSLLSEGTTGWAGDSDLEQALQVGGTINATVLEFDFVPYTNHISFDYIFASEQYLTSITSPNQCNYTDGFAFLLKEAGSTGPYQNLAVVPGTDIPVRVNTVRGQGVCPPANQQFFGGFNPINHPVNYNGQTVIMKAQANVTAGVTYHIKLVIADQGNNLYDSAIFLGGGSFNSTTELGPDRLIGTGNPVCESEIFPLDATVANAVSYQWYKDGASITGATNATFNVQDTGEYSVEVQLPAGCTSEGSIIVEYATLPQSGIYTLLQCDEDNDGLTVFNLGLANPLVTGNDPELTVTYHLTQANAEAGTSPITNIQNFQNTTVGQQVYARVANQFGCANVSSVSLATSANGLTNPTPLETCDTDGNDDGLAVFDLTTKNAEILQGLPTGLQLQYYTTVLDAFTATNPIINATSYTNTSVGQTVYARIYNGSECYGIAELELVVHSFGPGFQDEQVTICDGQPVYLSVPAGYQYSWDTVPVQTTNVIMVYSAGIYTVTITDTNGCSKTKVFTVIPSGPATNAVVNINDFAGNLNSITLLPEGLGDYEFSLDGNTFYNNPTFTNLAPGEYTFYIRDKNGCSPVYRDVAYVLDYPKFFTPNGDGINDTWRIPYMTRYPDMVINVYDRYGKIVAGFTGNSNGWNGTLNGKPLPAADYWFVIQMPSGKLIKGHFAIIR